MKRIFTVLSFLFFLPFFSSAQNYNSAELEFITEQNVLVRNWNDKDVVSLVYSDGYRFVCTDFYQFLGPYSPSGFVAPTIFSDPLPREYAITDFKILNDTVFFCGSKNLSTIPETFCGIVGYFPLNQFMLGNITPHIFEIPAASYFRRLVVYQHNRVHKVVALGKSFTIADDPVILEIFDILSTLPTFKMYKIEYMPYEEIYDDVLYTGTKVVLVGTFFQGSNARPIVRISDQPEDIASTTLFDSFYYFSLSSNEINARTRSVVLDDGLIAMSYVHVETGTSQTFFKRLRVIDTEALPMPLNINSHETQIIDKLETAEMAYSSRLKKLVLLQEPFVAFTDDPLFYYLEPYNNYSYFTDETYFSHGNLYRSIDIYNSDNFVSVGMEKAYLQYIPTHTNLGCPFEAQVRMDRIPDLTTGPASNPPRFIPVTNTLVTPVLSTYAAKWLPVCHTY